jgi:hypothetical protein
MVLAILHNKIKITNHKKIKQMKKNNALKSVGKLKTKPLSASSTAQNLEALHSCDKTTSVALVVSCCQAMTKRDFYFKNP